MARHPEVPFWLCVGDLASRTGAYPDVSKPLYWIKGNNEDFDRIAAWEAGEPQPRHLHLIPNGTAATVGPLRVAGLGGTFAPTWFETPTSKLHRGRARSHDDATRGNRRSTTCSRRSGRGCTSADIITGSARRTGRASPRSASIESIVRIC